MFYFIKIELKIFVHYIKFNIIILKPLFVIWLFE